MFSGEESVRIADQRGDDRTYDFVEQNLESLGRVRVSDRGRISITPRGSFEGALAKATMEGSVRRRNKGGYEVSISYTCSFTTLGWVIFIIGFLLFLLGLLVILAPAMQRTEVARRISRSLQELEETSEPVASNPPTTPVVRAPVAAPFVHPIPQASVKESSCPSCGRNVAGQPGQRHCVICEQTF